jgi:hypothetical protein
MTNTESPARFDSINPGDQVYTLAKGYLEVQRVVSLAATEGRQATRLYLLGGFSVADADASTIMTRRA